MEQFEHVRQQLLAAPKVQRSSLDRASQEQGVYVLGSPASSRRASKLGSPGRAKAKDSRGRLQLHFSSHESNSVLARHLAADAVSPWVSARDFTRRDDRQAFICDACYFRSSPFPI